MKTQFFPHGLMLGPQPFNPIMIFKSENEKEVLPVLLDPVNAGIMMVDSESLGRVDSAHHASLEIFEKLGVSIKSIYFNEINGSEIIAQAFITDGKKDIQMKFKAREILSLALRSGCNFFASPEVIEKSKLLNLEWAMQQGPQHDQGGKTLIQGPGWLH